MMRKICKYMLWALVCIVVVLCLTEIILRVSRALTETANTRYLREYTALVETRIPNFWATTGQTKNPFIPPFTVYMDTGITNTARMMNIATSTMLLPSHTWTTYDFLQSPVREASTTYTVHSNALGFRGPEYQAKKPAHTYRIIVLGTYQAFGYGVNDAETYEADLEKSLSKAHPGESFEVWNMARPAGTAMDGLARMENGLFAYQPDLVVLDYGNVDTSLLNDSYLLQVLHLSGRSYVRQIFGAVESHLFPLLQHTLVWQKIWGQYYGGMMRTSETQDFEAVMKDSIALGQQNNVPVLLVREPWAPPVSVYQAIAGTSTPILDIAKAFTAHPLTVPPPADLKTGEWGKTWLSELDPAFLYASKNNLLPYQLNLFQFNARGLSIVAQALEQKIDTTFLTKS